VKLATLICPRCESSMSVRTNRAKGSKFIGCDGYPSCRYTRPYDVVLDDLVARVSALEEAARSSSYTRTPLKFADELKNLIFEFHPDRNPRDVDATRLAAALNDLRAKMKWRNDFC
jgi:ssDNA-binding Zn-finger/Zn-ribbon topoisomerase 1